MHAFGTVCDVAPLTMSFDAFNRELCCVNPNLFLHKTHDGVSVDLAVESIWVLDHSENSSATQSESEASTTVIFGPKEDVRGDESVCMCAQMR